jgi:Mg/Co/Ni transporter MgtE
MTVCGCFRPLVDGTATEKGATELLAREAPAAAKTGVAAALVVALVLAWLGGGPAVVVPRMVGAFALAVVLQGAVLLVGAGVLRALKASGS